LPFPVRFGLHSLDEGFARGILADFAPIRTPTEINGRVIAFGDITLEKFGPMQMELLLNALLDHGGQKTTTFPDGHPLSAKSVRGVACVLHGCFEKAVKWELIPRNPLTGVELPRSEKSTKKIVEQVDGEQLLGRARSTKLYPPDLAPGRTAGAAMDGSRFRTRPDGRVKITGTDEGWATSEVHQVG
jgi:hypothetical protein